MRVNITSNVKIGFRGQLYTYQAGEHDVPDDVANALIDAGAAKHVGSAPASTQTPKPAAKKTAAKKAKGK